MIKIKDLAKIVHEANRAYCEGLGDISQVPWLDTDPEIKASAVNGIEYRIANPKATNAEMHNNWLKEKEKSGWTYGEEKNAFRKTHPCIMPYAKLPKEQKVKDSLYSAILDVFITDKTWLREVESQTD